MTTKPRILVVDDEPAIADTIVYALVTEGFDPKWVANGAAALAELAASAPALVVLDVGLPDINGFDLFKQMQSISAVPVIFLTARSAEVDRVVGLELGADDYVAKPFSPRELVARVRAVMRRFAKGNSNNGETGASKPVSSSRLPFAVDEERMQIKYRGRALELSRYEYRLLKILIARPGRVFTRDDLMQQAWEEPDASFDRTVDAHIKTLRAKLRAVDPEVDPIRTHRGTGYALKEDW